MTDRPGNQHTIHATERAFRDALIRLPRSIKQSIMLVADAIGFFCCVLGVAWVYLITPLPKLDFFLLAFAAMLVAHLVARSLGFYHSIVRYLGMGLLMAGANVAVVAAIFLAAGAWVFGMTDTPFRLAVVFGAFCAFYLVGSRYLAQYFLVRRGPGKDRAIVYGAGESGARVVQAMHGAKSFKPVAFIDDDPALHGKQINGLSVYPRHQLEALIHKHRASKVLLAIPSASRRERVRSIPPWWPGSIHGMSAWTGVQSGASP